MNHQGLTQNLRVSKNVILERSNESVTPPQSTDSSVTLFPQNDNEKVFSSLRLRSGQAFMESVVKRAW